jgi:serine/threonine-protein kinase
MFDVLATKTGTAGIDILYYLVTSKGGSKASKAADAMLADPKIVARGSEAMQVAWELRNAPCAKKRDLFERAGKHGDQRTVGQLFELNRSCGRRNRSCCLHKDPDLEAAIDALKARGYGG